MDIALKAQPWGDDASFGDALPAAILVERAERISPTSEDVVCHAVREMHAAANRRRDPGLHNRLVPHLPWFTENIGAWQADVGGARAALRPERHHRIGRPAGTTERRGQGAAHRHLETRRASGHSGSGRSLSRRLLRCRAARSRLLDRSGKGAIGAVPSVEIRSRRFQLGPRQGVVLRERVGGDRVEAFGLEIQLILAGTRSNPKNDDRMSAFRCVGGSAKQLSYRNMSLANAGGPECCPRQHYLHKRRH
ncbi:hypothetical protein [Dankookia sp. P2]|uniref:hypothetical protein n=1 Tax=Dankookia sp. P2 TaxID=3423955 RepID=UPI003D6681EC